MPAYDIGPRIGIEGEKEFRNSIKAIDSEVRALGNELKTLSKEYDKNDTSIEGVTKKQQTLNKAIGAAKDQIKLLSSQYDKQYQELKRLETALDSARKLHGENSEEALRAEAALAKQAKTVNDLGARLERAKGRLITFENQMEELGNSATRAGEQIQNAGEKISGIGGAISNVGNALTVGVTTPILAAATAAVSLGNDFEAQMSRVQAIAGATSTELEALTDQALQLGADTSFSASEVAQGMENLASAGFTVEEIMAAMSGMLDLAASSGADLATSSEIAASAIRGFGLDASDAAHVADVFAEASARTNAQTEDMGEAMKYVAPVASAMSQSLEETAAAIGIMSDAGIKGSQAGTSLRGALSRLAKPTQPVADKMDELGLSFYDAAGNMLPLNEMIEQLQDRFQGLTQEQQNNALVTLFGQESLSGMLALIQRGPEELRNLTASFESADGAAAKMAQTMLDNTAGTIEEMTGSLETAGITIQRVLAPYIRDAAQAVTGLANDFAGLDEEQQKNIVAWAGMAAAAGPAVKIIGTATKGLGSLAKGAGAVVGDLGKLVKSGGKATDSMSAFGKVLGTLGPKGLIVGGVVAGAAAIGTAILKAREDMIRADIEGRFGEIALSAEEIEDIANRLTSTQWTIQVDTYIDAKEQLDEAFSSLEQAKADLEKETWKISLGLDLSEENRESYVSSIEGYIQSAIATAEQASYTAQVSINTVFIPGSEAGTAVSDYSQMFYNSAQVQLQELGDELAQVVDQALGDNILTNEELLNINSIQSRMQAIMDQIADRQYKVELKKLEISVAGEGLTVESFQDLMQAASEELQERIDSLNGVTAEAVVTLEEMRDNRVITQAAFDKWKQQMEVYLAGNIGEMVLPTLELGLDTIKTNYEDVITQTRDEFQSSLDEAFKMIEINPEEVNWFNKLWMELDQNFTITDGKAREGVSRLVAELSPTKEELESVRQQYVEAGKVPPAAITEGLNDIYALEQMSGAADNTLLLLAQSIAESEEKQQVLAQSILTGQEIDAELAQALRDNYGLVWDASAGMFVQIQEVSFLSQAEVLEFMNTSGVAAGTALATALSDEYGVVYNAATGLWEAVNAATAGTTAASNAHAKGQEIGSASGTGYVEGANAQTGNVEEASSSLGKAGEQALSGTQPNIEAQATETGTAMGESLASGIESTEEEVDDSAATVARSVGDAMQDTVDGIVLDPPEMATPDWTSAAAQGRSGMQSYLNNNPLTVRVNQVTGSRVNYNAYAEGGIVDKPEISLVGEAGAEAIIPLENNRARALDLWREAGERLNAFAAEQGRTVGSAVRERLVQQNEDNHREMHFAEGAVVIHTQAVDGRRLYREFTKEMQHDVKSKEAAYGKNL